MGGCFNLFKNNHKWNPLKWSLSLLPEGPPGKSHTPNLGMLEQDQVTFARGLSTLVSQELSAEMIGEQV